MGARIPNTIFCIIRDGFVRWYSSLNARKMTANWNTFRNPASLHFSIRGQPINRLKEGLTVERWTYLPKDSCFFTTSGAKEDVWYVAWKVEAFAGYISTLLTLDVDGNHARLAPQNAHPDRDGNARAPPIPLRYQRQNQRQNQRQSCRSLPSLITRRPYQPLS